MPPHLSFFGGLFLRGTPESIRGTLFRSSESRSSKTSEFRCSQPDGSARNSPLQEAKHVPFSGTSALKS